jgi:hypothetical protein
MLASSERRNCCYDKIVFIVLNFFFFYIWVDSRVNHLSNASPVRHLKNTVRLNEWYRSFKIEKKNIYNYLHSIIFSHISYMFVLLLSNYSVFETEAETTRTTLHQIEPHTARHHSLTVTRKARPPPARRSPPFSLSLPDVDPLLCSTLLFSISGDCFQFQVMKLSQPLVFNFR